MNPPVIHRDFTPDNLILHKDGTLKLIDFNVAKQVVESTTSGTVVGKHAYLPPEQFRGMPERASDIYAMGATIHYLLCGQDPEPISTSHPKRVNPALSDEINALVERATALDLQKRYKNIHELQADLNAQAIVQSELEDSITA
ncbi:MAG: protein kinase, partial [Cyanobacteria bacterium]|nr:protein kinase [Cyanobacteriota bacterium]